MNPIHQNRRALSATEIVTQLTQLNGDAAQGWKLIDGALEKTYSFANFHDHGLRERPGLDRAPRRPPP